MYPLPMRLSDCTAMSTRLLNRSVPGIMPYFSLKISATCINGIIKTKIWYNRNNQYGLDSGNMDMTAGANKSGYPMS